MTRETFASLHVAGDPVIIYNIWDAGSARAVESAGAKALATGSAPLAGAHGYPDGEKIPFDELLAAIRRIKAVTNVPLSVDIESGYAADLARLESNAAALAEAGAIGCNLEDQLIGGEGLRPLAEQAERIAAVSNAGLFVNARTDIFLKVMKAGGDPNQADLVDQALERAAAFREAGAGCLFVPGLSDSDLISRVCEQAGLPVNVIRIGDIADNGALAKLGVSRISYGGAAWKAAMAGVETAAAEALTK